MKKVSVITVNYNEPEVTIDFLQSVFTDNTYKNCEIIVVDNGSKKNFIPLWESKYKDVIYIRSEENLGFSGGNNLGIKKAGGDYLFFTNNDTEFTGDLIEKLVNVLEENHGVGIVSPKIMYHDRKDIIQYAGFTPMNMITGTNKFIGAYEKDKGQYDHMKGPTGFIHGAAMMTRRSVIEKAGLMPEIFFLYYEELDWCEQIKKAGYQVWLEPAATIYHKESMSVGKTSGLKEYYLMRNRILYMRRNAAGWQLILFYIRLLTLGIPKWVIIYMIEGKFFLVKCILRGFWWNLFHKAY